MNIQFNKFIMKQETVEIYVNLTETEVNKKSRELADVLTEAAEIKDELQSHTKTEKAMIEAKEVRAKELIQIVQTGKEKRSFECTIDKDYEKKEWLYKDSKGNIVKTEPFALDDFQREFEANDDLGDKGQIFPEEPVTEKTAFEYTAAEIKDGKEVNPTNYEDVAEPGETLREAGDRIVDLYNKTREKKALARKLLTVRLKE